MQLTQKITSKKDGTYSIEWDLTEEQKNLLITYAINDLLDKGLLDSILETPLEDEKQMQLDFLTDVNAKDLYEA